MTKLHLFVATNSHPVFSQAIGFTLFKSFSVLKTMRRPSRVKPKTCEWKEKMLSGVLALWIHSLPTLLAVTFLFTWMHQRFISNETITCLASFKQIPQEIKKRKFFSPPRFLFHFLPLSTYVFMAESSIFFFTILRQAYQQVERVLS